MGKLIISMHLRAIDDGSTFINDIIFRQNSPKYFIINVSAQP